MEVHRALDSLHHPGQHAHFIHAGIAHIHVQQVRAGVRLADGQLHHIVRIILQQGLLQAFLARWIDPLADDPDPVRGQAHRPGTHRADDFQPFRLRELRPLQGRDIFRIRSAAAPQDFRPGRRQFLHGRREAFRVHAVGPRHRVRQARVGLGDHRQRRILPDLPDHGYHFLRSQGAVDAHRVRPQALQGPGHGCRRAAGKGPARGVKAHGHEYRQACGFLRRQQRRPGLRQVAHGLNGDHVCAGFLPGLHHLPVQLHRLREGQGAQGLQHHAQGTHIQAHQPAGLRRAFLCDPHPRGDDLLRGIARILHLQPVGAEGIGVDNAAPRPVIGPVNRRHHLRVRDVQGLRNGSRLHTALLQHGTHGPVQQHRQINLHRTSHPFCTRILPAARSTRIRGSSPPGAGPPGRQLPSPTCRAAAGNCRSP